METLEKKMKAKQDHTELYEAYNREHTNEGTTELDQVLTDINWNGEFAMKAGVNAITGQTTGSVIIASDPIFPETMNTKESFVKISNETEMESEFQTAFSGEYNIQTVKVKGSAEYLSNIKFNQLTCTILGKYNFEYNGYDEFEKYELTPEAKKILDKDAQEFRDLYGDYFIAGGKRMGSFIASFTCTATKKENLEKFTASLGGGAEEILTAEGNAKFMQRAAENQVSISWKIFMEGVPTELLAKYKGDEDDILAKLEWFKKNAKGTHLKAKLKHYCTVDSKATPKINIAPDTFIELSMLYTTLWDIRALYDSCPPYYRDDFEEEKRDLDFKMTVKQPILAKDAAQRLEMKILLNALKAKLKLVDKRMKFYFDAILPLGNVEEYKKGEWHKQDVGTFTKSFGITSNSPAGKNIVVYNTAKSWTASDMIPAGNIEIREDDKIILGWWIKSYNDGANNQWKKDSDRILLGTTARVVIEGAMFTAQNWELNVWWVWKKDYKF